MNLTLLNKFLSHMAWIFDIKCPTTSVGSILDTVSEDTEDTAYASILSVYIKDTFSAYLYRVIQP